MAKINVPINLTKVMLRLMILARLLYGMKIELVIDGTLVDIAYVNSARTLKLRRVRGKVWWAKRRRMIVRRDNGKGVEVEEVRYGMGILRRKS